MVFSISSFLEVNGSTIQILQKGSGSPIIILTGMGCSFDEWYEIAEIISQSNRVIMYHRPGLGKSEIGLETRNTKSTVNELAEIMFQLHINEPTVIVAHSYGGLCAQHFAKEHPDKVAGLILVDSTSIDLQELDDLNLPVINGEDTDEVWLEKCYEYTLKEPDELKKIINPILTKKQLEFPPYIQKRLIDFQISPVLYKAMYDEISNWKRDAEYIRNLSKFPKIPLMAVCRDKEHCIKIGIQDGLPEWEVRLLEEKWEELIKRQADMSSNGEFLIAKNASHSVHLDRPDIIIDSIKRMVDELCES
ncbi:alpha/beta hydrolase [Paucisalibacillus sp. EB02]|uniref:alpha/beta hydrolase n=1 Tax=Paucisalibacillus sp. EB02 TaxID=1347087 RepID=UPI0004B0745B|nr:alpha/beta hydrolase [Paucisalibacillus sp. EB02]